LDQQATNELKGDRLTGRPILFGIARKFWCW